MGNVVDMPSRLGEMRERFAKLNCKNGIIESGGGPIDGGGGPPYFTDMERRVSKLEDKMENVQKTLSSILVTLAKIESCMATKGEIHVVETSLTEVKVRVNSLPTLAKISTIVGIASLVVPLLLAVSMALLHHYTKLI